MDGFKLNDYQENVVTYTYGFKIKDICDRYLLTIENHWLETLYGVHG